MKLARLQEVTVAICLGSGVIGGAFALNADNEADRAIITAEALEAQGNPLAAEWQAYADDKESDRNHTLLVVCGNLGSAACIGVMAASSRRREQEDYIKP